MSMDTFIDLIPILLLAVFATAIGFGAGVYSTRATFYDLLERLKITPEHLQRVLEELQKEIALGGQLPEDCPMISVKIEKFNDHLYAYREDDGSFLAQGLTTEELFSNVAMRIQGVTLRIKEHNGAELIRSN